MIKIQNLHKAFGNNILFEDFNLNIDSGDYVTISGESGCGKTTLLNMIGGLERINQGKIDVFDLDITKQRNLQKYFAQTVGFVFQNFALIDDKTVMENLKLVSKKNRSNMSITQALESVGLEDKANNKVYTLSGGEQQRIALARLMIKKCNLILADEPTGSLDKKNADIVMHILKQMHETGKTIVLVTHDEEIKKMGNRVINL